MTVDRYGGVVVLNVDDAPLLDAWVPPLREALGDVQAAYAKIHPRSAARLSAAVRRELAPEAPLWGRPVDATTVVEFGARYEVRPSAGLSVGLFLDMREVRAWLRSVTNGLSVLNLFAYTCSLGVSAALGRAQRVLNVDVSRAYLNWGKANYALNGLPVSDRDFVYGDAFDWLHRFGRRSESFDLVIVDPPSFSSRPFSVTRDYARLVAAAASVVSPGGELLAATNHAATSEGRFDAWLSAGLEMAGRAGVTVKRWHEPQPDFPIAAGQRPYLNVRALRLD